ncbi:MAG TPA: hypothetical protein HPP76_00140 [Desulfuromonadales bacterium]|nr:hypothetical protein [Desulfuromonadales bacterium]
MIAELIDNNKQLAEFLVTKSSVPLVLLDQQQRIYDCNAGFLKLFSLSDKPLGVEIADYLLFGTEGIAAKPGEQQFTCNPRSGVHGVLIAHRMPQPEGLLLWCERPLSTNNQVVERMSFLNNEFIALQRELNKKNHHLTCISQELVEKVAQLEAALAQVKSLEGIIHICMYCKKIRDEEELWHNIERYISEHSDAEFSHGICPVCFEERYGENL